MNDHFTNQLPTDPDWLRKADELVKHAAQELGCFVVLIAAQENGKIATVAADNDDEDKQRPFYKSIAENMPLFLSTIAFAAALQDRPPPKSEQN